MKRSYLAAATAAEIDDSPDGEHRRLQRDPGPDAERGLAAEGARGPVGVLARDPAVRFDRSVTDIAGRTGVGFYTVQEGYLKEKIMINPRTYAYMGYQDVAIRAHTSVGTDMTSHFRRGQILGWEARLASGIVQRAGQLP